MKRIYSNLKNRDAVTVYYFGNFLGDFSMALTFSIYGIFLFTNGLNLLQVNLINFIFMISVFLFEVPTGAFADTIGRKNSVLIGSLFTTFGLALYPIYKNFLGFAIAEFLLALSASFTSGAWDAWMVDTSKKQGFNGKVDYVFSQANVISKIALVIAGLIGAYLAYINLDWPFYFGAFIAAIGFIFLWICMEEGRKPINFSIKSNILKISQVARESIQYSLSHKVIFWLLLGGIVSTLSFQPMNMYWNIRFNNMSGNHIWLMGWLWVAISLFMLAGSYSVRGFLKRGKDYTFLMILVSLGVFLPIIFSALSRTLFLAFPAYLLYELARGVERPVGQAFINKYAEPSKRATIFSFESMMSCLGAAGGLIFFGWVAKNSSIETSWIIAAILALLLIPIYLMARKKISILKILENSG